MRLQIALTFFLAASPAFAGERDGKEKPAQIPADYMHFAHSWEAAKAEASERNVPIHITFHQDHCAECTLMDKTVYPDKAVILASRLVVNVYCHGGNEHEAARKYGTEDWCENAYGMACDEHRKNFKEMSDLYFKGPPAFPTSILCTPDGTEIKRRVGFVSGKQLIEMFQGAVAKVGPGLGRDEYIFGKGKLKASEEALKAGKTKDAVEALNAGTKAIKKFAAAKTVVDQIQAKLDEINKAGMDVIAKAKEDVLAGKVDEARRALLEVSLNCKTLECSKAADREIAALPKNR